MFDTHLHLDRLSAEQRAAWVRAGCRVMGVGTHPDSWELQSREEAPQAYGLHPWWVGQDWESKVELLKSYLPKAVALGEFGLDRGPRTNPEQYPLQAQAFEVQLNLARQSQKPVILHLVKAHGWALELMGERTLNGVVHGFSGSLETAREYLKRGLSLGIGKVLLRSSRLARIVPELPLDRLVLESDAPFQMEQPEELWNLLAHLAQLRGLSKGKLEKALEENAERIFGFEG